MKVLGVWEKSFEGVSGGHEVRLMVFVSEVNIRTTPVNKTLSLHCYRKYKTGAALRRAVTATAVHLHHHHHHQVQNDSEGTIRSIVE